MRSVRKSAGGAVASAVALLLVASCSSKTTPVTANASGTSTPPATSASPTDTMTHSATPTESTSTTPAATDPLKVSAPVTLNVAGLRPGSTPEAKAALDKQVGDFNAAHADIKVVAKDYNWDASTFQAQLQSNQVPVVFTVPFTDGRGLIEAKQIADMTTYVKAEPYGAQFNPGVLGNGQDAAGNIYGIPYTAYGVGLNYNRKLFKDAGLDPDKPPTTWDEVEAAAKAITAKTGKPGYVQMSKSNTGGWQITTAIYTRGGRVESADGKTATINTPAAKDALTFLHKLRWEDKVMGSNVLLDWPGINAQFAAGNVGMYTQGADVYTYLIQNTKMNPADYGLTVLPVMSSDPNAGVLGGGSLAVVKATATEDEKKAAMQWIDYYFLSKLTNQDAAVRDAKQLIANKQPVGTPALPIFTKEQLDTANSWVKDLVNVPLEQMKGFNDNMGSLKIVNEPAAQTQAVYAVLDGPVQKVLSDPNANIDALLTAANTAAQNAINHPAAAK